MKDITRRKPHPIAKINYLPRVLAAYSYLLFLWLSSGSEILALPSVLLLVGGLTWPHLAYWLSGLKGTKRQELMNMNVDTLMSACICLLAPNPMVVFSVLIVLFANALFTGFLKLLVSTVIVFLMVTLPCIYYFDIQWIEVSKTTEVVIMGFLTFYFSFFAFMGYQLIKQFLILNKKVHDLSIKDPLTRCFNRLYLDKELPREVNRCFRMKYPMTLIFADIDFFKKINDTLGHSGGDEVLKVFVEIMTKSIRDEFDWIARFGGEEFIVVLANSNTENGTMVAERIRANVENHKFHINGEDIKVTSSFGVTGIDDFNGTTDAEKLLSNADKGLYIAKENGRNRVEKVLIDN